MPSTTPIYILFLCSKQSTNPALIFPRAKAELRTEIISYQWRPSLKAEQVAQYIKVLLSFKDIARYSDGNIQKQKYVQSATHADCRVLRKNVKEVQRRGINKSVERIPEKQKNQY